MLIGLISDTHGLMRESALKALRGVDLILHAGDVGRPRRAGRAAGHRAGERRAWQRGHAGAGPAGVIRPNSSDSAFT